ncbi:MAG: Hsp70 family protein, partial [Acidimicrobiales bacterium]
REATDVLIIHGGHRANINVTRDEFEQITGSLLQRTVDLTRAVLAAARDRGVAAVDKVLLVGGSSKMPGVGRRLKEEFGFDPVLADPDLAVAKGAAIYGQKKELEQVVIDDLVAQGKLQSGQSLDEASAADRDRAVRGTADAYGLPSEAVASIVETEVQNVCSRGFGIVLQSDTSEDMYAHFLTHRNDRVPLVVSESFSTVVDDQPGVKIRVFEQGGSDESTRLEDNNILIEGDLDGIPPGYPRGTAVEVMFSMGSDGTLDVTARHVARNEPLRLRVDTGAALSDEAINRERSQVSLAKQKA